jgi:hypothetical protein
MSTTRCAWLFSTIAVLINILLAVHILQQSLLNTDYPREVTRAGREAANWCWAGLLFGRRAVVNFGRSSIWVSGESKYGSRRVIFLGKDRTHYEVRRESCF